MVDEREGMSIFYVVCMTAVILALVILFALRSHYITNQVSLGRHGRKFYPSRQHHLPFF
jgi:hypothetical protein